MIVRFHAPRTVALAAFLPLACYLLSGCGGSSDPAPQALACGSSLVTSFKSDANTTVLAAHAFAKGEPLLLSGTATAITAVATSDVCVVKLVVGPANPGPADAPSTSAGSGIEVWLPSPGNWNGRMHNLGGAEFPGGVHTSTTALAGIATAAATAMVEGAVSAVTDGGHADTAHGASFGLQPDGSINTVGWAAFNGPVHAMAVVTKALARAYYLRDAKYAYFDGGSSVGIQGHHSAQNNPADYDGMLSGYPAINAGQFTTANLEPSIVYQRDLGGAALTSAQLTLMGNAAIASCDVVGGQHLGYLQDPGACAYDPATDPGVLCSADGGTNTTAACVTVKQATAMNKMWHGQTTDGSVVSPAVDNGCNASPTGKQLWWGLSQGVNYSIVAGTPPISLSTDFVAVELQDPTLAGSTFINGTGNGANGWTGLTYSIWLTLSHAETRCRPPSPTSTATTRT